MQLLWPWFLSLLLAIPLIVGMYFWVLRRRRQAAVRFSSLALVRPALVHQSWLRRYLPSALFLASMTSLIVALARPVTTVYVPSGQATIILAMDVSRSMCSTDIQPSRIEAAKAAASSFVQRQRSATQIGVVAFSSFAELVQPPTNDQETLQTAINDLRIGSRTAIGSGIAESINAIAEILKNIAPVSNDIAAGAASSSAAPTPAAPGKFAPAIIVLLTDGVSNTGVSPIAAAQLAADRGIRVYTIGFGTDQNGQIPDCGQDFQFGDPFGRGQPFGGGGFGGGGFGGFRRGIDEAALKQIASMTGGAYYSASSASQLQSVFNHLPTYLLDQRQTLEISALFAGLGTVLAAAAIALSLLWHPIA